MKVPTKAQRQAWAKLLGARGGKIGGKSKSPAKVESGQRNTAKARAALLRIRDQGAQIRRDLEAEYAAAIRTTKKPVDTD